MRDQQKGFTIIELLIGLSIAAVVALSVAHLTSMLFQRSSDLRTKLGQVSLQKDLQKALRKKSTCVAAVQGRTFTPTAKIPMAVLLDNGITVAAAPGLSEIRAYGVQVDALDLSSSVLAGMSGTDEIYYTRAAMDSHPIGQAQKMYSKANIALLRIQVRAGQIIDCTQLGDTTDLVQVTCDVLAGTMVDGICRLPNDMPPIACSSGEYLQGFDSKGNRVCKTIPVDPPTPPAPPIPDQRWTWRGIVYQTTCTKWGLCDGVEWATCEGPACAGAKISCYFPAPPGIPSNPIGSTQDFQPSGFACTFF